MPRRCLAIDWLISMRWTLVSTESYEPHRNYRDYQVTAEDRPFLSSGAAGKELGRSDQTVVNWVENGTLPGRRGPQPIRPRYEIPKWAVTGLKAHRAAVAISSEMEQPAPAAPRVSPFASPTEPTPGVTARLRERVSGQEDVAAVLRQSREHLRKADRLRDEAHSEIRAAYELLEDFVSASALPEDAEWAVRDDLSAVRVQHGASDGPTPA